ncbi:MAG: DUF4097 family beta strand repeat-containing protein [Lachnospiraceae bacterium]
MGLFSSIIKAGMKQKADDKEFYDVTSSVIEEFPSGKYNTVRIESCLDLRISFVRSKMKTKVYLVERGKADLVHINCEVSESQLNLDIKADTDSVKGYIYLPLFTLEGIEIVTSDSNVNIKNLNVNVASVITTNGDVRVTVDKVEKCTISTESGDILTKIKSNEYDIKAKSKKGDILIQNVKGKENSDKIINCSSITGDILIEAVKSK